MSIESEILKKQKEIQQKQDELSNLITARNKEMFKCFLDAFPELSQNADISLDEFKKQLRKVAGIFHTINGNDSEKKAKHVKQRPKRKSKKQSSKHIVSNKHVVANTNLKDDSKSQKSSKLHSSLVQNDSDLVTQDEIDQAAKALSGSIGSADYPDDSDDIFESEKEEPILQEDANTDSKADEVSQKLAIHDLNNEVPSDDLVLSDEKADLINKSDDDSDDEDIGEADIDDLGEGFEVDPSFVPQDGALVEDKQADDEQDTGSKAKQAKQWSSIFKDDSSSKLADSIMNEVKK